MNYLVAADTDVGNVKSTNQDSLSVKVINSKQGKMTLAILCDGMGGLEKGEVASASVINAFDKWAKEKLPLLCENPLSEEVLRQDWEFIVNDQNLLLHKYGGGLGINLGTTLVALLIIGNKYYCMNIGDSRAYVMDDNRISQITKDQTFVAREVEAGRMTEEEARNDSRRSVLLQCVGASDSVYPEMICGNANKDESFVLCCDGFIHEITSEEIHSKFKPSDNFSEEEMTVHIRELIDLNKRRQERDNISAILIRTY